MLPDELTADDLEVELAKLVEKLKIEEGLEASANGQTVSHEEVPQRMARWAKSVKSKVQSLQVSTL